MQETHYGKPTHNDAVTSVKVRDGCTFKAYKHIEKGDLLETITKDESFLKKNNDEISTFSCTCMSKLI